MAEAMGVAGVGVGVVPILTTLIKKLKTLFHNMKHIRKDCAKLIRHLNAERVKLLQWASHMNLGAREQHDRFGSSDFLMDLLGSVKSLHNDGAKLEMRYGTASVTQVAITNNVRGALLATNNVSPLRAQQGPHTTKTYTLADRLRWACSDLDKFEQVLRDLSKDVPNLLQVTKNYPGQMSRQQMEATDHQLLSLPMFVQKHLLGQVLDRTLERDWRPLETLPYYARNGAGTRHLIGL